MNIRALKIQTELHKELDQTFGNFVQSDIGLISDAIERFLPEKIESILTTYTSDIILNSVSNITHFKTIETQNLKLQIRIYDSIDNPSELLIGYIPLYKKDKQVSKSETTSVKGYGKYDTISIICPDNININSQLVLLYSKILIESCYSWFFQKMKIVVKENTINASYIYACIKTLFPNNPEEYKSIWALVVNEGKVVYLLDDENIEFALSQIKSYKLIDSESPIKQLSALIKMNIEYENTFVRLTANSKSLMSVNPLDSKSAEYSTLLAVGEAGIWEEDATVFPVLTEGKMMLFLAFPTKYISSMEPIFNENKEYLATEFLRFHSRIQNLIKIMTRQNYDLGEIGKFAGNFFGGLINGLQ